MDIVEYFLPKIWWVENPRYGYLREQPMVRDLPFVDIDYCQFSTWGYQKPTRFWGSPHLGELPHKKCPGKRCKTFVLVDGKFRHRERLGGDVMHFNTTQKGRNTTPLVVDYLIRDGEFAPSVVPKSKLLERRKGFRLDPKIRMSVFV